MIGNRRKHDLRYWGPPLIEKTLLVENYGNINAIGVDSVTFSSNTEIALTNISDHEYLEHSYPHMLPE